MFSVVSSLVVLYCCCTVNFSASKHSRLIAGSGFILFYFLTQSCPGGTLGLKGGLKVWFSVQSFLWPVFPPFFLCSSLASFSRLTLWPSLKTPAAVGGEREGGKGGGGGGRGWGCQVCQSFHPPVAIPLLPHNSALYFNFIVYVWTGISLLWRETYYCQSTSPPWNTVLPLNKL